MYPGMEDLDDLLKEYNKSTETNQSHVTVVPKIPPTSNLLNVQPQGYIGNSGMNNNRTTQRTPPTQTTSTLPQKRNDIYCLQGSSANYSSSNPYQKYGSDIIPPPPNTSSSFRSTDVSSVKENEKKNEISDTQHKVNTAKLEIFQYFNDTSNESKFNQNNDYPTNIYQQAEPRRVVGGEPPPAPPHQISSGFGGFGSLLTDVSGFGGTENNATSENPYRDISSKPKYYFPRPRDQLPPIEEDEGEVFTVLDEEARKKQKERELAILKKKKERLMKIRMQRMKKFRAKPIRGIFGMPLEDAVIRPYDDPIDEHDEFTCSFLPFPLYRLINHLDSEKFLKRQGLYRKSGSVEKLEELKKLYNKGQDPDLSKYQVNTCTSLVKDFLKSLPDPIIPYSEYHSFMDAALIQSERFRVEELRLCVRQLPNVNLRILKALVEHLRRVTDFKSENSMDQNNLGIVFAPTILRGQRESRMDILKSTPDKIKIVSHLIGDYQRIFL